MTLKYAIGGGSKTRLRKIVIKRLDRWSDSEARWSEPNRLKQILIEIELQMEHNILLKRQMEYNMIQGMMVGEKWCILPLLNEVFWDKSSTCTNYHSKWLNTCKIDVNRSRDFHCVIIYIYLFLLNMLYIDFYIFNKFTLYIYISKWLWISLQLESL